MRISAEPKVESIQLEQILNPQRNISHVIIRKLRIILGTSNHN